MLWVAKVTFTETCRAKVEEDELMGILELDVELDFQSGGM
jgi:hypothetical protein